MRNKRQDRNKIVVCRAYERLRKRWQNLVEGNTGLDGAAQSAEATSAAHDRMVEHRGSCEQCQEEDRALKHGDLGGVLSSQPIESAAD